MIFVFYILALILIYLSYRSFRGGIDYLNYFKTELAKPRTDYAPLATVIAPCKGLEDGLEHNLRSLFEQDYSDYELVFVVDDANDPAVILIQDLLSEQKKGTHLLTQVFPPASSKLVVAPKANHSSQKVENLREAVLHVDQRSEVFVFVDSDAPPAKDWLQHLIAPLRNPQVGVATGYRWFISTSPSFPSELRNIWNASIASALGPNTKNNFCWGGSTAIRRDTFERLDIREKWNGTLSDDFTLTNAIKDAGLQIRFVPQALTASIDDCSFSEMLEFTTRQMKITRVYSQKYWLMSFLGSGLFFIVMTMAIVIAAVSPMNQFEFYVSITTLFLVAGLSVAKSWLRLESVRLVLRSHDPALRKQRLPQLTLWLISPFVFLYNCIAALLSRRLTWRGIEYELVSNIETKIIKPR